jgi:hypothetical protein
MRTQRIPKGCFDHKGNVYGRYNYITYILRLLDDRNRRTSNEMEYDNLFILFYYLLNDAIYNPESTASSGRNIMNKEL